MITRVTQRTALTAASMTGVCRGRPWPGNGCEQGVLPEVVGLPSGDLIEQVRVGPAAQCCRSGLAQGLRAHGSGPGVLVRADDNMAHFRAADREQALAGKQRRDALTQPVTGQALAARLGCLRPAG